MTITNERTYRAADVVAFYTRASKLQPPEAAILSRVKSRSLAPRMLDLGVGGGRTTAHFSSIAKSYLGADYSAEMVRSCTARFPHLRFVQADARAMPEFDDGSFDFVLFSYNGIDYVDGDGRKRALHEIRRVLAPGGSFAFSTHNLNSCHALFFGSSSDGFIGKLLRARWRAKVRGLNVSWEELRQRDVALINDGAFQFRLMTFYIKPAAQISHLVEAGFDRVDVFGLKTGAVLAREALGTCNDPWLYYFCEVA